MAFRPRGRAIGVDLRSTASRPFKGGSDKIGQTRTPEDLWGKRGRSFSSSNDDGQVLEETREIVAALGYRVISARSGQEALSIIRNDATIDLLFTDISMPGMDGWELARRSKQLRPELKVLYTTGFSFAPVPGMATPGYGPRLPKPWRPAQLHRLLQTIFH
jgi:CheY-like chemotaxis protein